MRRSDCLHRFLEYYRPLLPIPGWSRITAGPLIILFTAAFSHACFPTGTTHVVPTIPRGFQPFESNIKHPFNTQLTCYEHRSLSGNLCPKCAGISHRAAQGLCPASWVAQPHTAPPVDMRTTHSIHKWLDIELPRSHSADSSGFPCLILSHLIVTAGWTVEMIRETRILGGEPFISGPCKW